jgi:hypothetical protein
MSRALTSPFPLDEHITLPMDTLIAFSQQAAHFSPEKQHCEDPIRFDGFRYSKLRAKLGSSNKYLFATTGADHTTL